VRKLWWLALPPGVVVAVFVFFIMPFEPLGRTTVVARGELSCGQVMLTQTFTVSRRGARFGVTRARRHRSS
jgi:hypothetical protein